MKITVKQMPVWLVCICLLTWGCGSQPNPEKQRECDKTYSEQIMQCEDQSMKDFAENKSCHKDCFSQFAKDPNFDFQACIAECDKSYQDKMAETKECRAKAHEELRKCTNR